MIETQESLKRANQSRSNVDVASSLSTSFTTPTHCRYELSVARSAEVSAENISIINVFRSFFRATFDRAVVGRFVSGSNASHKTFRCCLDFSSKLILTFLVMVEVFDVLSASMVLGPFLGTYDCDDVSILQDVIFTDSLFFMGFNGVDE